ncbi:MAG: DUF1987 domain-containing protein [Flavobacteriales bacterium]|nr:DUF1987 domain-containing protein [Flavobacteriales bacterium]
MDVLKIEPTEYSFGVNLDPTNNCFQIWGVSRPEDARLFFHPILEWLDEYHTLRYWRDNKFNKNSAEVVFEFKLEYINSTSAKFILDILIKIESFQVDNIAFKVQWFYNELDRDVKESGEAFEKMCKLPFEYISQPD